MLLRLPQGLHYPITVTELLKQPNDDVERFAPLFSYSYQTTVTEGDALGEDHQVQRTYPAKYESDVDGLLQAWKIKKGDVITKSIEVADIDEPCSHSVQFGGMCANCSKDMTQYSYVTGQVDAARAPINMVHDNVLLKVSQGEAAVAEDEAKRRLLSAKKLSLVVDLDQTVIQATVDPTVAEWQRDPQNPNYEAVKDVRSFQLKEDSPGGNGMWYYIKFRPGLEKFLEDISKLYELHIYTMGTRAYAKHIGELIDPEHRIFGNRILSRSENGALPFKDLHRLFPVDSKMVVIIDDRGDVWNWTENLIKVTPFEFFVGIGDINASFLPKRQELPNATPEAVPKSVDKRLCEGDEDKVSKAQNNDPQSNQGAASSVENSEKSDLNDLSTLEQLASLGGGDDPKLLEEQTTRQDEIIMAQRADRPLLQKQKQLEAEEPVTETTQPTKDGEGNDNTNPDISVDIEKPRHHLLRDDDRELQYLEKALRKVHSEFFETHARNLADLQGGRLAQLRPGDKRKQPLNANSDLAVVPDIKILLPQVKQTILHGTVIVFTHMKPIHVDVLQFDQAILARNFGARIESRVSRRTTHVVAGSPRTPKAKEAFKRNIKVVNPHWVRDSITQWEQLDEAPYLMKYDGADPLVREGEDGDDILSDSDDPPSAVDTEDEDSTAVTGKTRPALSINIADDEESDVEGVLPSSAYDDKSPIGGEDGDWIKMNEELELFLAEDGGDEENADSDSVASGTASVESNKSTKSTRSNVSFRGKKRSRPVPEDSETESESPGKKKRGTKLSQSVMVADEDSGLPTPDITGGEEATGGIENGNLAVEGADEGDGWSEFDDDLEAEMEKAAKEEQGEG